jgi:hypothetical protein
MKTRLIGAALALLAVVGCDSAYDGQACLSNDNCQPLVGAGIDYACSAVTLTCVHGVNCSKDSDCSDNFACSSGGQCVVACDSDLDCAPGFHCSGESNAYGLGGTCSP